MSEVTPQSQPGHWQGPLTNHVGGNVFVRHMLPFNRTSKAVKACNFSRGVAVRKSIGDAVQRRAMVHIQTSDAY
jgi:hypothetical protein